MNVPLALTLAPWPAGSTDTITFLKPAGRPVTLPLASMIGVRTSLMSTALTSAPAFTSTRCAVLALSESGKYVAES